MVFVRRYVQFKSPYLTDFTTGADVKTGAVFCRQCDNFIYDAKLDEIYLSTVVATEEKLTRFQGESTARHSNANCLMCFFVSRKETA